VTGEYLTDFPLIVSLASGEVLNEWQDGQWKNMDVLLEYGEQHVPSQNE
jgi:hypothetical protein